MLDDAVAGMLAGKADRSIPIAEAEQNRLGAAGQVRGARLTNPGHEMDTGLLDKLGRERRQRQRGTQGRANRSGRDVTAADDGHARGFAEPFGQVKGEPACPVGMTGDRLLTDLEGGEDVTLPIKCPAAQMRTRPFEPGQSHPVFHVFTLPAATASQFENKRLLPVSRLATRVNHSLPCAGPHRKARRDRSGDTGMAPNPDRMRQAADAFGELARIMARLREPETGCPWDLEQDFATIAPYTIEEAYEVADAIERRDMGELREELGDLLFQVMFHSRMAEEAGAFTLVDVIAAINDKMIRRHPHVFGDKDVRSAHEQSAAWEVMKAAERARKAPRGEPESALDSVARALPALLRAEKLQKRAARTGFDWTETAPIFDKLEEEVAEVKAAIAGGDPAEIEDEVGDLLFVAANLARRLDIDPEQALRKANTKFERRFRAMEAAAAADGVAFASLPLDTQETYWQRVKAKERE